MNWGAAEWDALGSMLQGATPLIAIAVAVHEGEKALSNWRRQRREEARAAAARNFVGALLIFQNAVRIVYQTRIAKAHLTKSVEDAYIDAARTFSLAHAKAWVDLSEGDRRCVDRVQGWARAAYFSEPFDLDKFRTDVNELRASLATLATFTTAEHDDPWHG